MLPISICMIAKNEEKHIEECLKRLKPYHYEIVLADTGSTDSTLELAAKYTDKIYHFDWIDDFSAARNFALSKTSNDWTLSIDCDEYIENIDEKTLGEFMRDHPLAVGQILIKNRCVKNGLSSIENVRVSRFFNKKYYGFSGAIHEQITPKDADSLLSRETFLAPVSVLHVGYEGSKEEMQAKCLRNIELLEKELERSGADPYIYFQLGQSYMKLNDYSKAYEWFDKGLAMDIDPSLVYVQTMVESYGYCLLELKRFKDALRLLNIYDIFAIRADFVFLTGLIYMNNGLFEEAVNEFKKSTTMSDFSVEGINSYKAFYNIGVIYECTGRLKEAVSYYKKCGSFGPALARLEAINK